MMTSEVPIRGAIAAIIHRLMDLRLITSLMKMRIKIMVGIIKEAFNILLNFRRKEIEMTDSSLTQEIAGPTMTITFNRVRILLILREVGSMTID